MNARWRPDSLRGEGKSTRRWPAVRRLVAPSGSSAAPALNKNRPATFRDVGDYFADPKAPISGTWETTCGDHGRIETRRHDVVHDVGWLLDANDPDRPLMPATATIGRIVGREAREAAPLRLKNGSVCLPLLCCACMA